MTQCTSSQGPAAFGARAGPPSSPLLIVVCALAPLLNLVLPAGSPLHMSDYAVALVGKIMCYAICALAMDLIWGYTGILSLGHGLFFALGGYMMGMYLMRQIGRDGNYKSDLPDFMVFLDWKTLPWHWTFSDSFIATLVLIVAVPGLIAFVFGFFAFRSRIKGVYFSIITQAMTFAAMLLFFRNETGFGGNNGFTDFKRILGIPLATQEMRMLLFVLTGLTLLGFFLFSKWLIGSKFGRVLQAIRDAESRVMFSGYNPLGYKLTIWVISAVMCGVAGALYVPQVGIINPGEMSAANSIEIAIWAAVGGRASLVGPIVGAFIVNGAKSWLTVAYPEYWLYFLGALFIAVTLFLPNGIVGLVKNWASREKKAPSERSSRSATRHGGRAGRGRECLGAGAARRGNQGSPRMTPDLMEAGAERVARHAHAAPGLMTESGGRAAGYGRHATAGEVDTTHGRILYLEDVSVSFDGFKAINKLSLDIAPGELRCIIGPNGAGKTTMMDIITGKTRPDEGTVFFGSTIDLLRHKEAEIAQLGIGRKFQKPTVFEHLTVFENLELALKTDKGVKASMLFKLDSAQCDRLAEVLHTIHLESSVLRLAGNLSHGQKQWLEIGMLLMQDPKLLLLDEPVAGMTDEETARTAELFLKLKGKHSLMVVEHDMSFIRTISEIVTVLCDGSVLAQGTLDEVQADERVIEVYLGR